MPGFGAYSPSPQTFGAANSSIIEAIQNTLAQAQGGGLTNDRGTILWLENHATARVLADLYGMVERLGNQWDPERMTTFLGRWEMILNIRPRRGATLQDRQRAVQAKLGLIGKGTDIASLNDFLSAQLGDIFVGLSYTDPMEAISYVPGGAVVPGGPTLLDGDTLPSNLSPYYSTVGYVAILLEKPVGMSNEDFYERAGSIYDTIDGLFGAWIGFDWVQDGPNGAGFFLDEDNNLDNQRFD